MTDFPNIRLGIPAGDTLTPGQPIIQRVTNTELRLIEPYAAVWDGGRLDVIKGFVCDLSSIPRVLHSLIPKTGLHDGPSVLHDWAYQHRLNSRKWADEMFLSAMVAAGVGWVRRNTMYLGVRAGGWAAWADDD